MCRPEPLIPMGILKDSHGDSSFNLVHGTPLPPQLEAKIQQKSGMGVFLGVLVVDLLCAGLKLQSPWESYRIPMGIFGFISHFRATLAPFLKVWEAS